MAGTAGSGGLGALTVGGIATVAVVVGGVVLMQMGVFSSEPPIDEQANTNGQVEVAQTSDAKPKADVVSETGETTETAQPPVSETQVVADTVTEAESQVEVAEVVEENAEISEQSDLAAVDEQSDTPATDNSLVAAVADTADAEVSEATDVAAAPEAAEVASDATEAEPQEDVAAGGQTTTDEQAVPVETATLTMPDTTDPAVVEEPSFVLTAPELDLVRFDTDGSGVIAGRAQAGVQISVLLDDTVLDRFMVQNGGEFVSLTSIEPSIDARVVSIMAAFEGQTAMSDATFILAPSRAVATVTEEPADAEQADQAQSTQDAVDEVVAVKGEAETTTLSDEAPAVVTATEDVAETQAEDTSEVAATDEPIESETEVAVAADTDVAKAEEAPVEDTGTTTSAPQPVAQPAPEEEPEVQPTPTAVAVLKTDSEGVELVQPATPVAPELLGKVALDTISYSDEGDVQLAGRAQPASLIRVYLDNSPVADILAADNGRWKGELSDIAPGIYTLRLDELDSEGVVLSRLETPFKRESPEALQLPAAPEDNPAQAAPLIRAVTVEGGDTLWAISRERYGDGLLYVRVFEANKGDIRDPDLIYPGQVFSIPE